MSRSSVCRRFAPCFLAAFACFIGLSSSAQSPNPSAPKLSPAEQRKLEQKLLKELKQPYKKWLTEEVAYIILPDERLQLLQTKTDAERDAFIQQFWLRRDPTPGTQANEFRDEYYRRVKYANERFAEGTAGWRTDRGVFYILYGPPDEIKHNEGPWGVPIDDDMKFAIMLSRLTAKSPGDVVPVYPFQKWRYRYIAGIGFNVQLEFVDRTSTGRYELAEDPGVKYEYAPVPGGLFDALTHGLLGGAGHYDPLAFDLSARKMEQLLNQSKLMRVTAEPTAKDRKPEEVVYWRVVRNVLPMQFRVEVFRAEKGSAFAAIVLGFQKRDLKFTPQGEMNHALVNMRGFLTDALGHPVARFENGIAWNVPKAWLENPAPAIYEKPLKLPPGHYVLQVEVQDAATGDAAKFEQPLDVPDFDAAGLTHSSLVLTVRPQAANGAANAQPHVSFDGAFRRDQRVGAYVQVYNLGLDPDTHKPRATVEYLIMQGETVVFRQQETPQDADPTKLALTKIISLADVPPGEYLLKIRVTDEVRRQTIEPQAKFRIVP